MNTTQPRIGIIGGSGLGNALLAASLGTPACVDTPFGPPSAPPILAEWNNVPIAFLPRHGLGHTIPPSALPNKANIYALKSLGCQWIISSGAVGSLREEIRPRDLILPDQIIDKTVHRPSSFFDQPGVVVHAELAHPFCEKLRAILLNTAAQMPTQNFTTHTAGTYVCMEGPQFSTRAESLMHRQWGGDLIGMTAMPEAKLAREAEISYAMVALATDYDCWKPHTHQPGTTPQQLLTEIIGNMHAATDNAIALIKAALPTLWAARNDEFPAHSALQLGLWTTKNALPHPLPPHAEFLLKKYL